MKGTFLIATALLSLAIWAFFYFASLPLQTNEVPIVVIISAIVVYGFKFTRKYLVNRLSKKGSDDE